MSRWEYASILTEGPASRDSLNELGEQGWELISFLQGRDSGSILYVFKRPKPDTADEETATLLA